MKEELRPEVGDELDVLALNLGADTGTETGWLEEADEELDGLVLSFGVKVKDGEEVMITNNKLEVPDESVHGV